MSLKQTIIITPTGDVINPTLVASYYDRAKAKTFILDTRYHVHTDKLAVGANRFSYRFDQRMSPELRIVWDWSDDDKVNQIEIPFQKQAKDWFLNHPNIQTAGYVNPNLVQPLFKMYILEDMEDKEYKDFKLRLQVMNIVDNMTKEKRKDIAYYYGLNPSKMDDKKVLLSLVSPIGGALMDNVKAEELVRLMSTPDNKEMIIRTVVKKAITLGKILVKDGKYYGFGDNELIATSEEDTFKFYYSNSKMYDFLVKEVGISDFSKDRIEIKKEVEVEKGLSSKELKDRAKELNIQGWFTMSPEKLKIAIEEHELSKK